MNEENKEVFICLIANANIRSSFSLFISQYLAILFFQNEYKSSLRNLPGVVHDEKELKLVLKNYQKRVVKNSEDVLIDLRKILQDCEKKEFERIHFHYSGSRIC